MKPEIKTWLEDINRSIDEIYQFLPRNRDFLVFDKDLKAKKEVEKLLQ
jgi:hypothetical protein